MKQKMGRCLLRTLLAIEILSAVWLAGRLWPFVREGNVYTPMVHYFPEGTQVVEEWQRREGEVAFLAVQIPSENAEEFVRVLQEENFTKGVLPKYLPRGHGRMPREILNGMWRVDVPPNDANGFGITYHVCDLDTGIYYYVIGD